MCRQTGNIELDVRDTAEFRCDNDEPGEMSMPMTPTQNPTFGPIEIGARRLLQSSFVLSKMQDRCKLCVSVRVCVCAS